MSPKKQEKSNNHHEVHVYDGPRIDRVASASKAGAAYCALTIPSPFPYWLFIQKKHLVEGWPYK